MAKASERFGLIVVTPVQRSGLPGLGSAVKILPVFDDHRADPIDKILGEKSFAVIFEDHAVDLGEQCFEALEG